MKYNLTALLNAAQLGDQNARSEMVRLVYRELYRIAYAREPQASELKVALDYLSRKTSATPSGKDAAETESLRKKVRREAYEDTLWALINTKEFLFNH